MKVAIVWPRFGPYHLARLNACARTLGPRGVTVIGVGTAARETLNAWEVSAGPESFERHQVFPNRVFEDIPPREMERGIAQALDRLQPDALAVMSYGYPDARAALAWGRRHRRVVVNLTDTKEDDGPRAAWSEWIKRQIVGEFDAALVGGTPQRRYLVKLGLPNEVDRVALKEHVHREKLDGVEFCDYQTSAALAAYLGRASALVLPIHKDTWGLVVNEAMASGLPVIVSRQCGSWLDLVDDGRIGFTIDSTDEAALESLRVRMSTPDTDRAAMALRTRDAIAYYTPTYFTEGLYAAVLAGRTRATRSASTFATVALLLIRRLARSVTGFHRTEV